MASSPPILADPHLVVAKWTLQAQRNALRPTSPSGTPSEKIRSMRPRFEFRPKDLARQSRGRTKVTARSLVRQRATTSRKLIRPTGHRRPSARAHHSVLPSQARQAFHLGFRSEILCTNQQRARRSGNSPMICFDHRARADRVRHSPQIESRTSIIRGRKTGEIFVGAKIETAHGLEQADGGVCAEVLARVPTEETATPPLRSRLNINNQRAAPASRKPRRATPWVNCHAVCVSSPPRSPCAFSVNRNSNRFSL